MTEKCLSSFLCRLGETIIRGAVARMAKRRLQYALIRLCHYRFPLPPRRRLVRSYLRGQSAFFRLFDDADSTVSFEDRVFDLTRRAHILATSGRHHVVFRDPHSLHHIALPVSILQ
jgi:hypothetical protein